MRTFRNRTAMKKPLTPLLACLLMMLSLAGCGTGAVVGGEVATMYITKPSELPPADTAHQAAAHEDWCYATLGEADCFSAPQDVPPTRLINVEPQNRYPLNTRAYNEDLVQAK
jgi:hypothetical protein